MRTFSLSTLLGLSLGIFLMGYIALAWNPPSQLPPGGNTNPPITTSGTLQTKTGGLSVNGLWTSSLVATGASQFFNNLLDGSGNVIYDNSTKKIPRERLPFNQGDLLAPADRSLVSGLASYLTSYFNIANLGISGTSASNVKQGVAFGPGNNIVGTAASGLQSGDIASIMTWGYTYNTSYYVLPTCDASWTRTSHGWVGEWSYSEYDPQNVASFTFAPDTGYRREDDACIATTAYWNPPSISCAPGYTLSTQKTINDCQGSESQCLVQYCKKN